MELNLTITITDMPLLLQAINNLAGNFPFRQTLNTPPLVQPAQVQQPAPIQQPVSVLPPNIVPTTVTSYTLDDLARAAMTLMDAGKQAELQQLLSGFGVEALPMLPLDQYGAFATGLRGLGAQI